MILLKKQLQNMLNIFYNKFKMKEIVLDTETTGLNVKDGHRIVEIGCLELENLIPTKKNFTVILILKEKYLKKH